VLRKNDAKIRETERSLSYFEDTLRELQQRKLQQSQPNRYADSPGPPVRLIAIFLLVYQSYNV
jgi:hypothetical protein